MNSMLSGAQLPRCNCGFLGYLTPTFSNTHYRSSFVPFFVPLLTYGSRFPAFCPCHSSVTLQASG